MFFSPKGGDPNEILNTESTGRGKSQPSGKKMDINLPQEISDNYGYDSRTQPQMIENIMQGGVPIP